MFWVLQMWPDLLQKAKDGGLDVIQTYVFWNGHEPSPGKVIFKSIQFSAFPCKLSMFFILTGSFTCFSQFQYYFEDRYDLVKFIKLAQQHGLFVHLRIGPYICAEWNFG